MKPSATRPNWWSDHYESAVDQDLGELRGQAGDDDAGGVGAGNDHALLAQGSDHSGGDALGDPGRRVEVERQLDDAVAEPDVLRDLAAGGEEDLRRAGVRVLLEEVVLDGLLSGGDHRIGQRRILMKDPKIELLRPPVTV